MTRAQLEHAIAVLVGKPPAEFAIAAAAAGRADSRGARRRCLPSCSSGARTSPPRSAGWPRPTRRSASPRPRSIPSVSAVRAAVGFGNLSTVSRYWSLAHALARCSTAGCGSAQSAQAIAAYDETVANYRQTVLAALPAKSRTTSPRCASSKQEAAVQGEAVKAARESVTITNNQYRAGTVTYLAVVVVQAAALNNERAALAHPRPPPRRERRS